MFVHGFYEDEDIDLFYELDERGVPSRSVTVRRSTATIESAVSSDEWMAALREDTLGVYMARYGPPTDVQLDESDLSFYEELSASRFESIWKEVREAMDVRWSDGGRQEYESRGPSVAPWTPLSGQAHWHYCGD